MKKIELFSRIFDEELPKHDKFCDAFWSANRRFKEKTELDGYSDYNSFMGACRREKRIKK